MTESAIPDEDVEDGPECPECGVTTRVWKNQLSEDEHTHIISCPDCDFEIETESNLAYQDRQERFREAIEDAGLP